MSGAVVFSFAHDKLQSSSETVSAFESNDFGTFNMEMETFSFK